MYEFTTISGRVIEARRYMNRWPRLNEPDPARERWEVWISERSSSEVKLTVASRIMPARCGQSVTLVVAKGLPGERLFLAAPKLRASGEEDAAWTPRVQLTLGTN